MLKKLQRNKSLIFLHSLITAIPTVVYDAYRYIVHATLGGNPRTVDHYDSILTKEYHKLEKSLTYPDFKPYSAGYVIDEIFRLISENNSRFGNTEVSNISLHVIKEYVELHRERGFYNEFISNIEDRLVNLEELHAVTSDTGGYHIVSKEDVLKSGQIDLEDFFYSRFSIRNFSDEKVDIGLVKKAVSLAQKTPSVCNRQGWAVHAITDKSDILKLSNLQGGSRGFSDKIDTLLIVTSKLSSFHEIKERNQNWIDGGLFSMSLVYALHSLGLASCCLNWAAKPQKDIQLRKMVPLEDQEATIMMIAVGHYPDEVSVCASSRRSPDDVLHVHR
jgi:nitroreductase